MDSCEIQPSETDMYVVRRFYENRSELIWKNLIKAILFLFCFVFRPLSQISVDAKEKTLELSFLD